MIGDESQSEVDDGEYAITGGAGGRDGSGVTGALVRDVVGAWRFGDPFAFGGVEEAATLGACKGREADFGRGGGVVLRGTLLVDRCIDLSVPFSLPGASHGGRDEVGRGKPSVHTRLVFHVRIEGITYRRILRGHRVPLCSTNQTRTFPHPASPPTAHATDSE